jgi:Winged helix DNA-binding domain
MIATVTWSGVTARRMARHALAEPAADLDPAAVATLLCGAHAQVLSAAELERVELDGEPAWTRAGDTGTPSGPHRGVRLLSYFDQYVVAGQPRERLYPGGAAARALTPSGQAGNHPVLLVDGEVGGVWHQRRSGRRLAITVEPLAELTARQRRELDDEAALVGAVMEATPTLTVGPVTVGPHA